MRLRRGRGKWEGRGVVILFKERRDRKRSVREDPTGIRNCRGKCAFRKSDFLTFIPQDSMSSWHCSAAFPTP